MGRGREEGKVLIRGLLGEDSSDVGGPGEYGVCQPNRVCQATVVLITADGALLVSGT
jgi:hypothetical protein